MTRRSRPFDNKTVNAMTDVKPAQAPAEAAKPAPKADEGKPIGEVLGGKKTDASSKKDEAVPLATFLEVKGDLKAANAEIKRLTAKLENSDGDADVSDEMDTLVEEYGADPKFVKKLVNVIQKNIEKGTTTKVNEIIKPLQAKDEDERIEKAFSRAFDATMSDLPEYEDIVNRDVIKALSLNPANKDKTFRQLIEETYSKAIKGKKTMEETTPNADKEIGEKVDFARMKKDQGYYAEVMKNPDLKKQYNDGLAKRLGL
jgi:hypothetical protein